MECKVFDISIFVIEFFMVFWEIFIFVCFFVIGFFMYIFVLMYIVGVIEIFVIC